MNLLGDISRFAAQVFFAGLWQGIILATVVAICFRLYPRVSPAIRFATWSFAFALTLIIPLLYLPTRPDHATNSSATVHLGAIWGYSIVGVWAVLMVVRATHLIAHVRRLIRIWRQATPILTEGDTRKALERCSRSVELCTSADVDSPSVIGFWSARLLVPEWLFAKLAPEDLRQVVLHELEHLRRCDDWINLMQKIGLVLFPINPALLWMDRQLTFERELACDAGVVAATAAPFEYANCLTRLAEHRLHYRKLVLTLSAWTRQSELARRVQCLLRPAQRVGPFQARVATMLLGLALAGGGLLMARAPRFISFVDSDSAPTVRASASIMKSPVAAAAVPVVYRNTGRPHATLLEAVMPAGGAGPASHVATRGRPATGTHLHKARTRIPKQPRLLVTSARVPFARIASEPLNGKVVPTVYVLPSEFSPSYAAVAFRDGWLIIQL